MSYRTILQARGTNGWHVDLATHRGTHLENETCEPTLRLPPGRTKREESFATMFKQIRRPIAGYNCFGHIFAERRTALYSPDVDEILCEDGYDEVAVEHAVVGDVVVYSDSDGPLHVARVVREEPSVLTGNARLIVLSKFDDVSGEYEHDLGDTSWFPWGLEWRVFRPRARDPQDKPAGGWRGVLRKLESG